MNLQDMPSTSYSLEDVALMIKRHSHDVRNALNGMELELTLLEESATTPEAREAIGRLRESGSEINRLIHALSARYSAEAAMTVPAIQLAEMWNADAARIAEGVPLNWQIQLGVENVAVESALLRCLLKDVLGLALRINGRRGLSIECGCENAHIFFQITAREPQVSPGIIEAQQSYWAALERLGQRSNIVIEPRILTTNGSFPMRVSLPVSSSEA